LFCCTLCVVARTMFGAWNDKRQRGAMGTVQLCLLFWKCCALEFSACVGISLNGKLNGFKQCDLYVISFSYGGTWLRIRSLHLVRGGNVQCVDYILVEPRYGRFMGRGRGEFVFVYIFDAFEHPLK
jgi:hypothetical protein